MSFIAAAAISAGASLIGGAMSSSAAGRAAGAQADAANQAAALQRQSEQEQLALQREIYNQQRADIAPYRQAGLTAQNRLMTLLGLSPSQAAMAPITQFDQAGYDRAMQNYYDQINRMATTQAQATGAAGVPGQGPGYYINNPDESGPAQFWVSTAGEPGAAGAGAVSAADIPMPTREQFTTTMPVDQLQVDTTSPDFGKYAQDFQASAATRLPAAFTPSAEAALPTAFTPSAEAALPEAFTGQVDLQADPGYAFRLSEGLKALDRQAAARGGLISGGALKAAQRYGQDLASQEYGAAYARALTQYGAGVDRANQLYGRELTGYGTAVDRANQLYGRELTGYGAAVDRANQLFGREYDVFQSNRANALNPLLAVTGYGQLATNQLGGYGSQYATGATNTMSTAAANQANALGAAGQARASGYVGQANALTGALGGIANTASDYMTLNRMFGSSPYGMSGTPSQYGSISNNNWFYGE